MSGQLLRWFTPTDRTADSGENYIDVEPLSKVINETTHLLALAQIAFSVSPSRLQASSLFHSYLLE